MGFIIQPDNQYRLSKEISVLLNAHNNLTVNHSTKTILESNITYFVSLNKEGTVIGCCGLKPIDIKTNKIVHVCTHTNWRKKGIAYNLITKALSYSINKPVLMDIRHTNTPSLTLATKLGFKVTTFKKINDYYLLTVIK